jgi:16S rRNA (cytosine1402-N4)-methyltransferase
MGQTMSEYHQPVLLKETIDALVRKNDGIYIDVTYGGGGHSREILKNLDANGHLIVFDQDGEAEENIIDDPRMTFIKSNFRYIYKFWKWLDIDKVDGVFADLGVSSHQFDTDYRGFSYRFDAELDMRMNEDMNLTAKDILSTYTVDQLQNVFSRYGEIRNSKTLAKEIVDNRNKGLYIISTKDLNLILDRLRIGNYNKYFAQVYQALRMEVNDEMRALEEMLNGSLRILKPAGRLVVISYHSLEDRIVKRFVKSGNADGTVERDDYGRSIAKMKVGSKIIEPTQEEQRVNARSRSAKMRIGIKIE